MKAFCTITTLSYCPFAFQLCKSIKLQHREANFFHLIIDATLEECLAISDKQNYKAIPLSFIEDNDIEKMKIYFDAFELCNALKPMFFKALFQTFKIDKLIYLDSDIYVLNKFDTAFEFLDNKDVVLTPHTFLPVAKNLQVYSDFLSVQFGVYNGGFYGLKNSIVTIKILDWLTQNLKEHGFVDWNKGQFVDQKFLTLIPHYFPNNVTVLRDKGYNIAYWNVNERLDVQLNEIVFFHFSGYKPSIPLKVCSYISSTLNQKILSNLSFKKIFEIYKAELHFFDSDNTYKIKYRFNTINNKKLTKGLRRYYFINKTFKGYYLEILFAPFYKLYKKLKFKIIPN